MKPVSIKVLLTISALLFSICLAALPQSANADSPKISKTFSGFAFEKSILSPVMKQQIKSFVNAHRDYPVVSCVGFTGYNVNKRSQLFLQKLASDRAKNICNYIHSLSGATSIYSTQGIPGNGKTPSARRVTVTLYKVGGANGGGSGVINIGTCDQSLKITMQSRFASNEFLFAEMRIAEISDSCKGNVVDVYLIDQDGNQLAAALNQPITTSWVRLTYESFTPNQITSNLIAKVAIEIRKNP